MPIAPCFDPTTGASGGAQPGGGNPPPALTVDGRANGEAYTVPAGARSLTINTDPGAVLLTTVELASTGAPVPVTGNTTASPSWTAPSGGAEGDSYNVKVTSTLSGATSQVSFTERMVSSGLVNAPLTEVNLTDGTWTLLDPDNLVKSITYSGGFHTVTWNAASGGDYNWTATTTHRAPRWHKTLNVSGTDIQAGDFLLFTSRIQSDLTVADFNQQVVCGVAEDPTSTVAATIDGTGGYFIRVGTGNPAYGTWQVNTGTSSGNSGNVFGACTVFRGRDSLGSGVYLNVNGANNVTNSGSRNSNQNSQTYVGTVSVMVGVGLRANTDSIPQDAQQKFKVSFGALTWGGML